MGFACIVLLKLCTFAACETKLRRNPQDFYWKNKHGWIHVHVVAYFTDRNSSQTTLVVSMWCRMWGKSMLVSFQWWDKRNLTYCHAPRLQFIYMSLFVKGKKLQEMVKHVSPALHKGNYCSTKREAVVTCIKASDTLTQKSPCDGKIIYTILLFSTCFQPSSPLQ